MKFAPVLAEIIGEICRFLPSRSKRITETPRAISGVSEPIVIKFAHSVVKYCHVTPVNPNCDIRIRFGTPLYQMNVILLILLKIGYHGNVP